uniref:Flagellar associated protein n=1 Tax=Tetraselmis sp. GSL018 TaxID=582737 RepID=A0A061SLH3_9CHLO|mmetsp:Transcript_13579/g.32156  ORF Transcript_13579/g.32156 Transcript_13579/m.32156 type:complete len:385 (+) Transcript_13579:262-1416(+)|eukprot:CAMPEP_0177582310 /NCGR_PEP_ID=MMETSP0419_2-20121207/2664_1 /TAXON_ID=582737 /ORGANISM="Tetraselmis sp., Strain GSL018" /LENGTH=384 /DNA_ID=CAMNT_0019071513 /DNA_START=178 /DNA_END=1332 /DNA_ORIENTATION=-
MAQVLPYTIFTLGEARLHQLYTSHGKLFILGEVAVELFQESPSAFLSELRNGRYVKTVSNDKNVIYTVNELELPTESVSGQMGGVTLVPAQTVEGLLQDKRKVELVQPFRLALLKLASQEAARLMAAGEYEVALPVALDAVKQGQALFKPSPALQLFPLYLLAAQANLGLKRSKQCEDFLALASWLSLKDPGQTTNIMRSQLSRLYGQLYALQNRFQDALQAFAEDVYYCSLEYGPEDVRTSLGFYNLAKVFQSQGEMEKCLACNEHVVENWSRQLLRSVLGRATPGDEDKPADLPLGRMQLMEVIDMLQDICAMRSQELGDKDVTVGDTHLVTALALMHMNDLERAQESLQQAAQIFPVTDQDRIALVEEASATIQKIEADRA